MGAKQPRRLSGKTAFQPWNLDSPEKSSVKGRTGVSCSCFKLKRQYQQVYSLSSDRDIPRWSADRPNPAWWIRLFTSARSTQTSVCFVTPKHKVTSCAPDPSYAKTEEIAERKGVIFLHLKGRACVRASAHKRAGAVCACLREKRTEGKVRARRERDRKRPLIRWSQLITFSPPDGRHSSNLWPSGPSAFTVRSLIEGKQAWVYAGHRNRWVWGVIQLTRRACRGTRMTQAGSIFNLHIWQTRQGGKKTKKTIITYSFLFLFAEKIKRQMYLQL